MSESHHMHDPLPGSSGQGSDTFVRDTLGQVFHHDPASFLERLTTTFMALDHSWRITYLSVQSDPLLEQTRATLLGKTLWEVFPQAVNSPLYRKYSAAVEARSPVHFEEFYPSLNKWFEVHVSPSDERASVFIQDITSRKRAEKERGQLAAIVESTDAAIFSTTLDGVVISWNKGAERLYGYQDERDDRKS